MLNRICTRYPGYMQADADASSTDLSSMAADPSSMSGAFDLISYQQHGAFTGLTGLSSPRMAAVSARSVGV